MISIFFAFSSGLDCSISKQLIYLLHLLSRQGRTVVISMHQPSTMLLHMVDRLYAVVAGRCAYMGSVPSLLPYLREMNLICPPYHNPVDFCEYQNKIYKKLSVRFKHVCINSSCNIESNLIYY